MLKTSIKILSVVALTLIANCGLAYEQNKGTIGIENKTNGGWCLVWESGKSDPNGGSFQAPVGFRAPIESGRATTWGYYNPGSTTLSANLVYGVYEMTGIGPCSAQSKNATKRASCTFAFTVEPNGKTNYSGETYCNGNIQGASLNTISSNDGYTLTFRLSS